MLNFFDVLIDYIEVGFTALFNMIDGLITGIVYMMTSASTLSAIAAYLPSFISGSAVAVITLAVVKFLIGR